LKVQKLEKISAAAERKQHLQTTTTTTEREEGDPPDDAFLIQLSFDLPTSTIVQFIYRVATSIFPSTQKGCLELTTTQSRKGTERLIIMFDSIFYTTVVSFGLISLFIYLFVLPRLLLPQGAGGGGGGGDRSNNNNNETARGRRGSPTNDGDGNSLKPSSTSQQPACTRVPPHLSEQSARIATWGGMNVLVEGMVPFRYTKAAAIQEQQQQPQLQSSEQPPTSSLSKKTADNDLASSSAPRSNISISNRKDRARILSNLFHDTSSSSSSSTTSADLVASATAAPPEKGSTIVISIPMQDLDCPKLRRVLYLLGTYYNILVIIVVDSSVSIKEISNLRSKLRGGGVGGDTAPETSSSSFSMSSSLSAFLSADVLPDHRIVAASTLSARVAFARQLARKDLILDFDADVCEQLMRFGHRVITYGNGRRSRLNRSEESSSDQQETGRRVSKLGRLLLQS
jgi:hypothetical protein